MAAYWSQIIFLLVIFLGCLITTIGLIKAKLKQREGHISKISEVKLIGFIDKRDFVQPMNKFVVEYIERKSFPKYGIYMMIFLGLIWIGVIANMIHLTIIGGFRGDFWVFYISIAILFIFAFNVFLIIIFGYRKFAVKFSRGVSLALLALMLGNSIKGLGIVDPFINYDLPSARILMSVLLFVLPITYITIWLGETISDIKALEEKKHEINLDDMFRSKESNLVSFNEEDLDDKRNEIEEN